MTHDDIRIKLNRGEKLDRAGIDCPHCGTEDSVVMIDRPMLIDEEVPGVCEHCGGEFDIVRDGDYLIVK